MQVIPIRTSGPVHGRVRPPGSKSITNRALVCAALATGTSRLVGVLDSDDTRVMIESWRRLGVRIDPDPNGDAIVVHGCGGAIAPGPLELYAENSGTTIRFMAAVVATGKGDYRLTGNARMQQRPMEDLLIPLRQAQITAVSEFANGCPPIRISTDGWKGGTFPVAGDVSSQFLSGLMLAAPCANHPCTFQVTGKLVSEPYVEMTRGVMSAFGARTEAAPGTYIVQNQGYRATDYRIEPDASAASYFLAAAAITGGQIIIDGLGKSSLQGDVQFIDCLRNMGCSVRIDKSEIEIFGSGRDGNRFPLSGIDINMAHISDTVQTLAMVALFAVGPTTIRGVGHIRHKESDRIADLARELRKVGATVEEFDDGLRIVPAPLRGARLATYDDHRMAMSLSLIGLRVPGIEIENPSCVSKTYPRFFDDLGKIVVNDEEGRALL